VCRGDGYTLVAADSLTEDAAAAVPALVFIDNGGRLPALTLKTDKGEDIQAIDLANEKGKG
jgi:hypothetical protein